MTSKKTWVKVLSLCAGVMLASAPIRALAQDMGGRVGTIDTSKLAVDLGWDREMKTNMGKLKDQLEGEFKQLEMLYDGQLQTKKKAMGIKGDETGEQLQKILTLDQQRDLMTMLNTGRQNLGNVQQQANQQVQRYAAEWDKQYSDAIKPIVQSIAKDKKLSVVINLRATPLMYSDPTVDITDAVVAFALTHPPKLTPVEIPKINVSGDIGGLSTTQPAMTPSTPAPTTPSAPVTPTTPAPKSVTPVAPTRR